MQTRVQWQIFWDTNEVLWYPQRDGCAQMYLFDLASGNLKKQIATRAGMVTRAVRIDRPMRTTWYEAGRQGCGRREARGGPNAQDRGAAPGRPVTPVLPEEAPPRHRRIDFVNFLGILEPALGLEPRTC